MYHRIQFYIELKIITSNVVDLKEYEAFDSVLKCIPKDKKYNLCKELPL